jgi:formylglycine-generating enzyme required for sulfatase activity
LKSTLAALLVACLTLSATAQELPLGLTKVQPDQGPYVKTPAGLFMVPYTTNIPGTEIPLSMVPIPGGKFSMGSPASEAGHKADEGPQVEISIQPFWMAKTEISWAQYWTYMNMYPVFKQFEIKNMRIIDGTNVTDAVTAPTELYEPDTTYEYGDDPNMPAVTMTQYAAKQYTKWLSKLTGDQYRLPTEAEWEYACRAGTTTPYHFGDDPSQLSEYAWYKENSEESLPPVGKKKPNPWGLYDMHGSVWEWVLDSYSEEGYQHLADKADLTAIQAIAWSDVEYPRTVRGGSWDSPAEDLRSAAKLASNDVDWKMTDPNEPKSPWWFTDDPARSVGFRIVRPLKPLPRKEIAKYWEIDNDSVRWAVENRLEERRGVQGVVDEKLPDAILQLEED